MTSGGWDEEAFFLALFGESASALALNSCLITRNFSPLPERHLAFHSILVLCCCYASFSSQRTDGVFPLSSFTDRYVFSFHVLGLSLFLNLSSPSHTIYYNIFSFLLDFTLSTQQKKKIFTSERKKITVKWEWSKATETHPLKRKKKKMYDK